MIFNLLCNTNFFVYDVQKDNVFHDTSASISFDLNSFEVFDELVDDSIVCDVSNENIPTPQVILSDAPSLISQPHYKKKTLLRRANNDTRR